MGTNGVYNGFPKGAMGQNWLGNQAIKVENNCLHTSVPTLIVGNVTEQVLVAPTNGDRIIIKAMTVVCEGNTGEVRIYRELDDTLVLPVYVTVQARGATSSSLNLVLEPAEKLYVTTTDRGETNETFIGITYLEVL